MCILRDYPTHRTVNAYKILPKNRNYYTKAQLADLFFRWADVPPIQPENIEETSSIEHILLPRLVIGQSCQRRDTRAIPKWELLKFFVGFLKNPKSIIFRCSNASFTICPLNLLFIFLPFFKTVGFLSISDVLMHYIWPWLPWLQLWFQREKSRKKSLVLPFRSCNRVLDSWLSLHILFMGESEIFSSQQMKDGHAAKPWSREFRKQVFPKFNRPGTIPKKEKWLQLQHDHKLCTDLPNSVLPLFFFLLSVTGPHKT